MAIYLTSGNVTPVSGFLPSQQLPLPTK